MARLFGVDSSIRTSVRDLAGRLGQQLGGGPGGLSLDTDTSELDASGLEATVLDQSVCSGGSLWRSHLHIGHACSEFRKGEVEVHVEQVSPAEVDMKDSQELGRGAGGIVMRSMIVPHAVCARLAGKPVAVKVVDIRDKSKREQLVTEVNILRQISQDVRTLINCYGAFVQGDCVHVVLEYMDWSLSQVRRRVGLVPSRVLPLIVTQILDGLCTLHSRKVLHRDVKCANILVNKVGEVKVTDFGISEMTSIDNLTTVCKSFVGTLSHMSPERLLGEDYSYASDIWSVGVIAYELASGTYPYGNFASFIQLSSKVCTKPVPDLPEKVATPMLQSFIGHCMRRDPNDRKSAEELVQHKLMASHPDLVSPERCRNKLGRWLEQAMVPIDPQLRKSEVN